MKLQHLTTMAISIALIGILCILLTAGCGNHCCPEDSLYEMQRRHELERQKRVDPFDPERGEISLPGPLM